MPDAWPEWSKEEGEEQESEGGERRAAEEQERVVQTLVQPDAEAEGCQVAVKFRYLRTQKLFGPGRTEQGRERKQNGLLPMVRL